MRLLHLYETDLLGNRKDGVMPLSVIMKSCVSEIGRLTQPGVLSVWLATNVLTLFSAGVAAREAEGLMST